VPHVGHAIWNGRRSLVAAIAVLCSVVTPVPVVPVVPVPAGQLLPTSYHRYPLPAFRRIVHSDTMHFVGAHSLATLRPSTPHGPQPTVTLADRPVSREHYLKNPSVALNFNGLDSYVDISNPSAFNLTRGTMEAWVKTAAADDVPGTALVIGQPYGPQLAIQHHKAIFYWRATDNTFLGPHSDINVDDGQWHHLAGVWTPTGLQVYVDGLLQGSVTTSKVEGVVDCPYQIGGFNTSGCNGQDPANYSYFPGMIKEVRLWNSTRTPEQIGQTEYTTLAGTEDGLVGYWRLDEGQGTTAQDAPGHGLAGTLHNTQWVHNADSPTSLTVAASDSAYARAVLADHPVAYWPLNDANGSTARDATGNGHDGQYVGGVKLREAGPFGSDSTAASFNGSSGYVSVPGTWGGSSWNAVTVEAWVYARVLAPQAVVGPTDFNFQAIVEPTDQSFVHFQLHPPCRVEDECGDVVYVDSGTRAVLLPVITPILPPAWHYVVMTGQSGGSKIYVDGVEQGSNSGTFTSITAVNSLRIGSGYRGGRFFNGRIADVAIYNHALTPDQIAVHYKTGATGSDGKPAVISCGLLTNCALASGNQWLDGQHNNEGATCSDQIAAPWFVPCGHVAHNVGNYNLTNLVEYGPTAGNNPTLTGLNGTIAQYFALDTLSDLQLEYMCFYPSRATIDGQSFALTCNHTERTALLRNVAAGRHLYMEETAGKQAGGAMGGWFGLSHLLPHQNSGNDAGTWTVTGRMTAPRIDIDLTLLPNGNALAVSSWGPNETPINTAEVYNPHTGMWTATGKTIIDSYGSAVVLLSDGRVLVAGGESIAANRTLSSAELYDPRTNAWIATGSMLTAHSSVGILLRNGLVLVAGGCATWIKDVGCTTLTRRSELYDSRTGRWTATGSMVTPRLGNTLTLLPDGRVLAAGGCQNVASNGSCTTIAASAELYDAHTGTWSQTGSMDTLRYDHTATLLPNGKVLIVGGCNSAQYVYACAQSLATTELYDSHTGTWTTASSMTRPRASHTATLLPTGQVLVAGGYTTCCYNSAPTNTSAELYDPAAGTWTATASLHVGRYGHAAVLLYDGRVLVAGGGTSGGNGAVLDSAELYQSSLNPSPSPSPSSIVGHCPEEETIGGWVFRWTSCPVHHRVTGIVVEPPTGSASGFQVDQPKLVVGSLPVNSHDQLIEPVLLPNVPATLAGFSLTAHVLAVDAADVIIRTGTLLLPAALQGLACYPVSIDNLRVDRDPQSSLSAIRLPQSLQFTYAGAGFDVDGLALTRDGLAASSARMTLPEAFGGHGGFIVEHLLIGADGSVAGTAQLDTDLAIGDFSLHVGTIRINGDGLTFSGVAGQIPLATSAGNTFPFQFDDFTFDGTTITKGRLNAHIPLPNLYLGPGGNWQLYTNGGGAGLQLTVAVADGVFLYTLTGDALLSLPFIRRPTEQGATSIGGITAHVELGSITWDRPLHVHNFGIDVSIPDDVLPLGDSDLALTSLHGEVTITGAHRSVIYTIGVSAGIQDLATSGLMLDSQIKGTLASDGNFGVSGKATILRVAHMDGGICVQVTLSNDGACRNNLGVNANRASDYGTYASLHGKIDVPSAQDTRKHLTLTGNVFGHLWTSLQSSAPVVGPTPTLTVTPVPGAPAARSGPTKPDDAPGPGPTPAPRPVPTVPSQPGGQLDYHFYGDARFDVSIDSGYFASVHELNFGPFSTPQLNLVPPCPISATATSAVGTFHYRQESQTISGIRSDVTGKMKCTYTQDNETKTIDIGFGAGVFYSPPFNVVIDDHVDANYRAEQNQTGMLIRAPGSQAPAHALTTAALIQGMGMRRQLGQTLPPLTRNVTIVPGESSTFFTLGWAAGSPTLSVTAPNGVVYHAPGDHHAFLTPAGPGAYWFQTTDPRLLTSSSRAALALYLVHPQPGIWHVVASGLQSRANAHLVVIGNHPAPTVRVTVPRPGVRAVVRTASPRVALAGTVTGGHAGDTIGLYYTTNPTVMLRGQAAANLAGTLIADNIPVVHGRWRYRWDTRGDVLRRGRYYVYAQLNDGAGPIAVGYAPGIVQVAQQNRPGVPRRVRATVARTGRAVVLHWLPPANDGTIFGYVVRWRRDSAHASRWTTLHIGRALTLQLPPLVPRTRYIAEVASYDLSGVEGPAAMARFVAPVPQPRHKTRPVVRSHPHPHPRVTLAQAVDDNARLTGSNRSLDRRSTFAPLHAHSLVLRVDTPACTVTFNRLNGTPYANAQWRWPGPGSVGPKVLIGQLDSLLPRSSGERLNQRFYGQYDYLYAGDPTDVMLTVTRSPTGVIEGSPRGKRGYNKYYNPIIGRIGRSTGVIAILYGPHSVKPEGTSRNDIAFDPPGWELRDTHSTDLRHNRNRPIDRGHLLGDVLYGSNLNGRNAVAEYGSPNRGAQSDLEETIANDLRNGRWSKIYYRVEPHYTPNPVTNLQYVIPTWIEIYAIEVKFRPGSLTDVQSSDCIHVDIPNRGDATIRDVRSLPSPIPGRLCTGWPRR